MDSTMKISVGEKIHPLHWDTPRKRSTETWSAAKSINLKISQVETNLDRHFIVLQTQFENITPLMLNTVYLALPASQSKLSPKVKPSALTLLAAFDEFIAQFEKKVKKNFVPMAP